MSFLSQSLMVCLLSLVLTGCQQEAVVVTPEFVDLQNEQMLDPEGFGKRIIEAEVKYAAIAPENLSEPEAKVLQEKIKLMLAVVGSHSPE